MRALRALLWLTGAALLAVGVAGLLRHGAQTRPGGWLTFLLGGLLAHDLLLAPAVAAVSWAIARWLPQRLRGPMAGGLIVAGSLVAVAVPVVGGYGRLANNPSILPSRHYARDLLLSIAVVAVVSATLARRARSR